MVKKMYFKRALYYPYTDIKDENWLKNAIFYWDEISTIVPESVQDPYNTPTGQELYDREVLKPLYVDQFVEKAKKELTEKCRNYFNSSEGQEIFNNSSKSQYQEYIYSKKFPPTVFKRLMNECKKVDAENIIELFYVEEKSDKLLRIDSGFFNFYMTLLATTISGIKNIELLTDNPLSDKLSNNAKLDSLNSNSGEFKNLSQGTLINITFDNLQIDPDTPVDKIMEFKADHRLELTHFKEEVLEITSSNYSSIDDIIYDYNNKVKPELDSLKQSLRYNKIGFAIAGLVSSTSVFPFIGLIPDNQISTPIKALGGAGLIISAYTILYNIKKMVTLQENPYSYLLSVENTFKKEYSLNGII